ncbi:hypothetical protein CO180_00595 [candidate division WWE3 bacterium CG_4_9_14_3_um_filter_41_6]|uniref:Uncharacterized protein n=1 Tax=candidate division WWE3 bacterium CG_4_10_14_0_2_um_filter_41_14 TaxID=1975072 RepID=A0A2M7TJZ4_UNCKA|nr:MAG: hypothetical protein COY32_02495 [candidate division WWE3 bacterium CG_4_10_14_0_2_um_filter_41_14]PJA39487.1 MAG: hypothetical protein CO180_00595 [candidate division WWE3 bacterium CG_4_9_14_3_um_filter_41_6]
MIPNLTDDQLKNVPENIRPILEKALDQDAEGFEELVTSALDSSPILKRIEFVSYLAIQAMSLLSGFTLSSYAFSVSYSNGDPLVMPWYVSGILSIVAGHVGARLAQSQMDIISNPLGPNTTPIQRIMFTRFGKQVLSIRTIAMVAFLNIVFYGLYVSVWILLKLWVLRIHAVQ